MILQRVLHGVWIRVPSTWRVGRRRSRDGSFSSWHRWRWWCLLCLDLLSLLYPALSQERDQRCAQTDAISCFC